MSIVAVELSGGLANQLFQYAAGLALARRHGAQLVLDSTLFRRRSESRRLALKPFALEGAFLTSRVRFTGGGKLANLTVDGLSHEPAGLEVVRESGFDYDPEFERLGTNVYLRGYWQSSRYFDHLTADLRAMINIPDLELDEPTRTLRREIKTGPSVGIHVRRGDYLVEPYRSHHGVCSADYYRAAMERLRSEVPNCKFYVFSDDVEWCRANFRDEDTLVVGLYGPNQGHIDLGLLADCNHRILSNSSFSWWSAYLSDSSKGKTIAPTPWFQNKSSVPDLIQPTWELRSRETGETVETIKERVAKTRISVVIPARNRPAMLVEAVDSVRCQTKPASEIIIALSDADKETTLVANELARRHGVKVVSVAAANVSIARNKGVAAASGEWIAFLDDDDVWRSEKLEKQLTAALERCVGLVSCDFALFNDQGEMPGGLERVPPRFSLAEAAILGNPISGGSAAIVRADVLKRVGGFDEQLLACEDQDLWRRIVNSVDIAVLEDKLVRIRRHGKQMSRSRTHMAEQRRRLFAKMCADTPAELRHMLFPVGVFYWSLGRGPGVIDLLSTLPAFVADFDAQRKFGLAGARWAMEKLRRRRTT
jgi:hypothetical protein